MSFLANLSLGLSAFQGVMVWRNLSLFQPPPEPLGDVPPLSVLIPARDEEVNLPRLLASLDQQVGLEWEAVIVDDGSRDATPRIAREAAERDPRIRLIEAPTLPEGWAGKQHACHLLSLSARHRHWLFLDADVILTDRNALARMSAHLASGASAMHSGIPRQETGGWAEQLVIPLIHLILLGYLPLWEMRRNRLPALGAACGQMVLIKAEPYRQSGGHAAVRHRLHDATALAALFRKNGHLTDLFDATTLADCRMYRRTTEVLTGFAKNATEGMAQPRILPIWTFLLLGANLLPLLLALQGQSIAIAALALDALVYLALMLRFRQTLLGALTRPAGVALLVGIQWMALAGKWLGWRATWKGRSYKPDHG
jgi:hypothetical protein